MKITYETDPKKLAINAINILKSIRNDLDMVNLNMETFFYRRGYGRVARNILIGKMRTQQEFKKAITINESDSDCKTSCCLAGMIPSVDWNWAKRYGMDFNVMSMAVTTAISPPKLQEDDYLWLWLFSIHWNNNKEWAKERLDLVIDSKAYYMLKNYTKYYDSSLKSLKDINSIAELVKLVDYQNIEKIYILPQ